MSKINHRHSRFHWIHLIAVFVLGSYFVLSKVNLAHAFLRSDPLFVFLQLFIFGTIFSYLFSYLFSHEKFFPFAKDIENEEKNKEKKYLKKYLKHGKLLATFIIGVIGGPIFLSLTTRLLLNKLKYKYLFIFLVSFVSTLFTLGIGMGIIKTIF